MKNRQQLHDHDRNLIVGMSNLLQKSQQRYRCHRHHHFISSFCLLHFHCLQTSAVVVGNSRLAKCCESARSLYYSFSHPCSRVSFTVKDGYGYIARSFQHQHVAKILVPDINFLYIFLFTTNNKSLLMKQDMIDLV